ncbi:lipid II flippase family protein [Nonlabens xiamenensis]
MTDEVAEGKFMYSKFKRTISYMVLARALGAILAQMILLPFAHIIAMAV